MNSDGLVAWVPLDMIDGSRPSLEIAPEEELRPHYLDERRFLVSEGSHDRPDAAVMLGLIPGDVVLFSPRAPHRTYCGPGMTNTRLSLDMRFQ